MKIQAGKFAALMIANNGDMSGELRRRARGYGQPFRAILERAAEMIEERERVRIKTL